MSRDLKRKRRVWVRDWLLKRELLSLPQNEFKLEYRAFIHMKATEFEEVLAMVVEDIKKNDTVMRVAIPPDQRLAVTLRFLATGETFRSLMCSTRISEQAIGKIIVEVCEAIVKRLGPVFLQEPQTSNDWLQIASGFEEMWDYPVCIGALDEKQVVIRAPEDAGSQFFSPKKKNSIVLMAIADAYFKFIYADVDINACISDGTVWRKSSYYRTPEEKHFPPSRHLGGSSIPIPYHLIGDNGFALSERLLIPYPDHSKNPASNHFNDRLSTARRVVDVALAILASRFKVILSNWYVEIICKSAIILHNFLASRYSYDYFDLSSLDPVRPFETQRPVVPEFTDMAARFQDELRDFLWRYRRDEEY